MQLQLISIVLILHCMEYINCQHHASRHRQHKRGNPGCMGGCLTCSLYNGCLTCLPKLFFHLERDGMKQIGVCLASCPKSFFGTRSPEKNYCSKCDSECDTCFDKNFCTRCRAGSYLHKGRCHDSCPDDLVPSDTKRECIPPCPVDCDACLSSETCVRCSSGHYLLHGQCRSSCPEGYEPGPQVLECIPTVHCEVGEWSEWTQCPLRRRACSQRTRKVLQEPTAQGNPCPRGTEERECNEKRKERKKCGKEDKSKGERKNRNGRKEKENGEARRERKRERKRERDPADREDSQNGNKTEQRRRRAQSGDPAHVQEGAPA